MGGFVVGNSRWGPFYIYWLLFLRVVEFLGFWVGSFELKFRNFLRFGYFGFLGKFLGIYGVFEHRGIYN